MPSLGDAFRAAREARHLSLSDVSEQIYIRSIYLQSIEDEDWKSIAAPVYVRGFIRTYARFLGLDSEAAVEHYNELLGDRAGGLAGPLGSGPPPSPGPSIWVWLAGAAALALVGFVAYNYIQFQQSNGAAAHLAKPTLAPTAAPVSQATLAPIVATPTPKPSVSSLGTAAGGTLVVRVRQDSWVQVSVDGVQQLSTILPAGTEKVYRGKTASVRVGNAGGIDLLVNGKDVGSLGATGDVAERTFTLVEK